MITALTLNAAFAAIVLVGLLALIVRQIRAGADTPARPASRAGRVLTLPRRQPAEVPARELTARRAA